MMGKLENSISMILIMGILLILFWKTELKLEVLMLIALSDVLLERMKTTFSGQ